LRGRGKKVGGPFFFSFFLRITPWGKRPLGEKGGFLLPIFSPQSFLSSIQKLIQEKKSLRPTFPLFCHQFVAHQSWETSRCAEAGEKKKGFFGRKGGRRTKLKNLHTNRNSSMPSFASVYESVRQKKTRGEGKQFRRKGKKKKTSPNVSFLNNTIILLVPPSIDVTAKKRERKNKREKGKMKRGKGGRDS